MVSLSWLKDFIVVTETASFSAAASRRFTSQSALSRRIRQLEDYIGEPLFDRSTHKASLTQAGITFLPYARKTLTLLAEGIENAKLSSDSQLRTLRIASTHSLSLLFFPEWFRELESEVNASTIQLYTNTAKACVQQFQHREVDFYISYVARTQSAGGWWEGLEGKVIGHDALIPVLNRKQFHDTHTAQKNSENSFPLLYYSDDSGLGQILQNSEIFSSQLSKYRPYLSSHNASVLKNLALSGCGVAWLPMSLIKNDLDDGLLEPLMDPSESIELYIKLYRQKELRSKAANHLWRLLG